LLSIVIAASCALLFAIATDELFNGLNSNEEIAVGLCVEGSVLLNISEFPHRSRQSSYHTQFILTSDYRPFQQNGQKFVIIRGLSFIRNVNHAYVWTLRPRSAGKADIYVSSSSGLPAGDSAVLVFQIAISSS
jgi:hypothetical protein